ncbi:MAG: DUF6472 family protein [Acutalibacteraceae bacterium]|jgi:hypothetical protein|nr:hypothetical protein [Clostridiales bacterium]
MSGKSNTASCDNCVHYEYDEFCDCYCCTINLDEDEMQRFLSSSSFNCPYFKFYDDYSMVRKQN